MTTKIIGIGEAGTGMVGVFDADERKDWKIVSPLGFVGRCSIKAIFEDNTPFSFTCT